MVSAKRQVFMAMGRQYASTMKTAEEVGLGKGALIGDDKDKMAPRLQAQASDPGPSWNVYRRLNAGKTTKTFTSPARSRKHRGGR